MDAVVVFVDVVVDVVVVVNGVVDVVDVDVLDVVVDGVVVVVDVDVVDGVVVVVYDVHGQLVMILKKKNWISKLQLSKGG